MAKYRNIFHTEFMRISRALSDENRVRVTMLLTRGELCLCQITKLLDLSPSTVSRHMSILHDAGLVERRKEGRWHFYRLADKAESKLAESAIEWVTRSLALDRTIQDDAERLQEILKTDKEELCRSYGI